MVPETDDLGNWRWVANDFAGDLAQTETAGSDEAKKSGDNNDKDASSGAAEVHPKEGVPSDDNSNDLPREAAIDVTTATVSDGSDEAKKEDDKKAKDAGARGALTRLKKLGKKLNLWRRRQPKVEGPPLK